MKQDDLEYFSSWAKTPKKNIFDYSKKTIDNFIISKCIIKKSDKTIGLAIIKDDKNLYRFSITSEKKYFKNYKKKFSDIVYSFGKVSTNSSVNKIEPPKIRVIRNSPDENFIEEVIKKSGFQKKFSEDIFMTINNVDEIKTNQKIKTIY